LMLKNIFGGYQYCYSLWYSHYTNMFPKAIPIIPLINIIIPSTYYYYSEKKH
jgi:hypothetical protein